MAEVINLFAIYIACTILPFTPPGAVYIVCIVSAVVTEVDVFLNAMAIQTSKILDTLYSISNIYQLSIIGIVSLM
jgi:hypothetical protein